MPPKIVTELSLEIREAVEAKWESPDRSSAMFHAYLSGYLIAVLWRLMARYPEMENEIRELIGL